MEREILFLHLAGWGSGPGYCEAVDFEGPMRVFDVKGCSCMLSVFTLGNVKTKDWVAKIMGGEVRNHFDPKSGRKVPIGILPKGKSFLVHGSHVRLMG